MSRNVGGLHHVSRPAIFCRILAKNSIGVIVVLEIVKGTDFMRLILKILVAPVIMVLSVFVWSCALVSRCSAFVFDLAGTVLGVFGVLALITHQVTNGIILLVMAFLVSPFGFPMAAAWLLGKIQNLRYAIQDLVYY